MGKYIVILSVLLATNSQAGPLDVEVEIELGNKTRLWAEEMLDEVEIILDKKIADIDDLLNKHEDHIFAQISELTKDVNGIAICAVEKADQGFNSVVTRFISDRGFLGRLFGPKQRYPECLPKLDTGVSQNAAVRESAVCIYNKAIADKKNSYSLDEIFPLSEDISNAFYATWCSNVAKPGLAGGAEVYMESHFHFGEITSAWQNLKELNNQQCTGTGTLDKCISIYVDQAIESVDKAHPHDASNGLELLHKIKNDLSGIQQRNSNKEKNEVLGDIQHVLNFVKKNRENRLAAIEPLIKNLQRNVSKLSSNVGTLNAAYAEANQYCNAREWRKVDATLKVGTKSPLFLIRNSTDALISKYQEDLEEYTPIVGTFYEDARKKIENQLNEFSTASSMWKLNNTRSGYTHDNPCPTDYYCGRVSKTCNESGKSF